MKSNSVHSITLAAQFENLDQVRGFVGQEAEAYGLGAKAVYAVQLAVDEAFTNIVEHAYGGECYELIECSCRYTADGLVIELKDSGRQFNPEGVPDPDLDASLEEREIGGLGLYFMRQLMDEVSFSFVLQPDLSTGCNVLKMLKRKER